VEAPSNSGSVILKTADARKIIRSGNQNLHTVPTCSHRIGGDLPALGPGISA
jgi:hypothetical protein